uniref:Uncharacterized protein n=1 Tax=Oryza brachyantha TaxID=4533 RepID=J3N993_ORYBR
MTAIATYGRSHKRRPQGQRSSIMLYLKQLAGAACVLVLTIYLCRFLLLRRVFSDDHKLRFRLKVGIGFLYISLSAVLFYLSAAVMALPPWGAVAMWGMVVVAVELAYAFFFPYSCICIGDDADKTPPLSV